MIEDKTKTKHNITSITQTKIDQSLWIQCEVDIKTGYGYQFLLNMDTDEDIIIETIFVQLPGKNVFRFEK